MARKRSYTEVDITSAVGDLRNGQSLHHVARTYGIPRTTLRNRTLHQQPRRIAHENQQRLSTVQEEGLVTWILRQEGLGYAPTHAQVRSIVRNILIRQGDHKPLGKRWTNTFLKRHTRVQTKLGRRTDWQRIDCTSPANINKLFDLYDTVTWIPPKYRYNADEGGLMVGQGINGLVIGSSEEKKGQAPVKTDHSRSWTSFVECISATGVALNPLVIFKAKSIQDQWFRNQILQKHPNWQVTFSANGWTSNDIALEWLDKVFLPETVPQDPSEARLLVVDGHGSHTTDEFMTKCFLNNVYLLFLPAHTSHVTQPLDLGCFSALKTAYRRLLGDFVSLTDSTRVHKAQFLDFYAEARTTAFQRKNIEAGWRATGLYPKNRNKPLRNRWVVVPRPHTPPSRPTFHIYTPTKSQDLAKMLNTKAKTPSTRLIFRKIGIGFDKRVAELVLKDREIASLRAQLEAIRPIKRKKVRQDPNERFVSLAEIALQRGNQPLEPTVPVLDTIVVVEEDSGSDSEEVVVVRRSGRLTHSIRQYTYIWSDSEMDTE